MRNGQEKDMRNAIIQIIWIGFLVWSAGCESENKVVTPDTQPMTVNAGQEAASLEPAEPTDQQPIVIEVGLPCPMNNLTRSCGCNEAGKTALGRQTCDITLGWGACECEDIPETIVETTPAATKTDHPHNKRDATFEWKRVTPDPNAVTCEAGYYEGAFDGIYNSQAMLTLTVGFWASLPVSGDVRFTIEEKPGSGGEFFSIADGVFEGSAMETFPFYGDFRGTLDCSTMTFEGVLENCYYIVVEDKYAFEGIARSKYDVQTHTFIDGVWSVTEPVNSLFESAIIPAEELPKWEDLVYPTPLPVEPGSPIPLFPLGFKGGAGTWWGSFVNP